MKRIASGSQVASIPTFPADTGTPGFFADAATTPSATPTEVTPKWVNAVQEAICQTIEDSGDALSDDMDQFKNVVSGVHGIDAHATGMGPISQPKTRVAIASVTCTVSSVGGATAALASLDSAVTADMALVAAGDTCTNAGVNGAVVGGASNAISAGGTKGFIGGGSSGAVTANRATVVGGISGAASAEDAGTFAGDNPTASAAKAIALGGHDLTASGVQAVASGGDTNVASGLNSAAIGGLNSTASGSASAVVGGTGTASGAAAVCLGGGGTASASYSATLGGLSNTASGRSAAVVGGENSTVSGDYSGAVAAYASSCAGEKSALLSTNDCVMTSAADQSVLLGAKSCELIAPNVVAGGYAAGALTPAGANQNLTWRINSTAGTMILLSTLTQSGAPNADYAEMFPNATGEEIPPGTLLARVGRAVKPARPGERVCGVVSAAPAILTGGTGELAWANRDMTDEWGRIIYDDVNVLDAEGNVRYTLKVPRPSPHYDPTRANVPRTERPSEWTAVALVGQIRVRIGPWELGTLRPGEWALAPPLS